MTDGMRTDGGHGAAETAAKVIPTGSIAANCVIVPCGDGSCWVVDPGQDADDILAYLDEEKLVPRAILLTHAHFDHIGGVPGLQRRWPELPVYAHPADAEMFGHPMNAWEPDYPSVPKPANLRDVSALGADGPETIHTPGHTPGSVCYLFGQTLLSGDTLFAGSCGRTDFPGGNMAEMKKSLARLAQLPSGTRVIPGHGGSTTIGEEVAHNPFMESDR